MDLLLSRAPEVFMENIPALLFRSCKTAPQLCYSAEAALWLRQDSNNAF